MSDTNTIDLRSDTVTRPSPRMRRAMASAEVGDDVFMDDPTVNRLQERAARIFEREAALLFPSGSMANLVAIRAQTEPGNEVVCESLSHIYNYEVASMSAAAGVMPRVVEGTEGEMTWAQIEKAIRPAQYNLAQTGLICLENTGNMAGGAVLPTEGVEAICTGARNAGIPTHLDGARIFNAATALGESAAAITRGFDTISFCLSKGLGAPVGSMLVGSRDFIERARHFRKMFGGGMRQAGVLAAAGLVALEEGPPRLHEDHANARLLADRLALLPGITIQPEAIVTNILFFGIEETGLSAAEFVARLARAGVLCLPTGPTQVRMLTHCDVDRAGIERAADTIEQILSA